MEGDLKQTKNGRQPLKKWKTTSKKNGRRPKKKWKTTKTKMEDDLKHNLKNQP